MDVIVLLIRSTVIRLISCWKDLYFSSHDIGGDKFEEDKLKRKKEEKIQKNNNEKKLNIFPGVYFLLLNKVLKCGHMDIFLNLLLV